MIDCPERKPVQRLSRFKLPPDYKKHAITFLSFQGEELHSSQGNLFEVLQRFDRRFVVDSHINWFDLAELPENANSAFIIGTTADKEASPLRLLLETGSGVPKVRTNVFLFGMKSELIAGQGTSYLILSRLDEHATAVIDMGGLRGFEENEKLTWDTSPSIAEDRAKVLDLLGIAHIDEIAKLDRQAVDERLRATIKRDPSKCFSDFWRSDDVSRAAYARLLLVSRQARNESAEVDYPNVFGDRQLVQNALFLKAGILSKDRAVATMARFCGVPCHQTPPPS